MACEDLSDELQSKVQELSGKFNATVAEIGAELKERAKDIDPNIDTSGPDMWVGLDFDVSWKDVRISLLLPDVTIRDQRIVLNLPQVEMKRQDIIFHTPSVRMETKKIGEKPEFYCDTHTVIPSCTVRWAPIYADVPVPFMQEQHISLDLPEFKMDETEIIMGIPEFSMRQTDITLGLPQFTLKNISVESEKAKARGEALAEEGQRRMSEAQLTFRENNKVELGGLLTASFDCFRGELVKQRDAVLAQLDGAITGAQAAVASLIAHGAPAEDASLVAAQSSLTQMQQQRERLAADIEAKMLDLVAKQKEAAEKLIGVGGDELKVARSRLRVAPPELRAAA